MADALVPHEGLLRLDGRVALVTGAGSGLGRAIAIRLAEAGARVILVGRRVNRLERTSELLDTRFAQPIVLATDLNDPIAASDLPLRSEAVAGRLDIIVNNAGAGSFASIAETGLELWDETHALNLRAPFLVAKAGAPLMRRSGGGTIVNISSIAGVNGVHNAGAYAAAKAGLQMLTRVMAGEWGRFGIRANAIAPGYVETEASIRVAQDQGSAVFEEMAKAVPLRRNARPDDVARLALFLVSDAAAFVSGQTISIDGGPVMAGASFE